MIFADISQAFYALGSRDSLLYGQLRSRFVMSRSTFGRMHNVEKFFSSSTATTDRQRRDAHTVFGKGIESVGS